MNQMMKIVTVLCCVVLGLVACTSGEQGAQEPPETKANSSAATSEASKTSAPQAGDEETTQAPTTTAQPPANTGTITGRVTDEDTGEPLSDVYLAVGWKSVQLTAITDENGRYTVPNVPAGEAAPVFGFHDGGYRYRASSFDDGLDIMLKPGETYTYDFSLTLLNEPESEPEISNPSLTPDTAAPGETVTFEVTASDGEGGLSPEIFASNPQIGKLVLLEPTDQQDRYRAEFTIPADTPPGDYPFAFFAASNGCYVNSAFPGRTLSVTG